MTQSVMRRASESHYHRAGSTTPKILSTDFLSEECRMNAISKWLLSLVAAAALQLGAAQAATVVALGASNTAGKGVSSEQAYPAQLEALLRGRGLDVRVVNAGVNGDTTGGMMARLESAVPKGTKVVILQPGGNDARKGGADHTGEIKARLAQMGVKVIMLPNGMFRGKPHQPDGIHLTPEGYRMLAQQLAGPVAGALGR
ncbi:MULTISPECIES: GDSL-type esterase/lipase family protein [Bradyrhizobium]|uniref:GDSL-type esterase/lipase family protein n=1 Tax=Bradyrhizobium TaxID=374 RepID=UPI00293E7551|nr:GDSL-type esterase/lipase family protein [Bradyrhizobium sp. NDS-1]WOH76362.1 GDSL-type esterase/lipase family protein [Bradyrhizobium sp. NDS-1]